MSIWYKTDVDFITSYEISSLKTADQLAAVYAHHALASYEAKHNTDFKIPMTLAERLGPCTKAMRRGINALIRCGFLAMAEDGVLQIQGWHQEHNLTKAEAQKYKEDARNRQRKSRANTIDKKPIVPYNASNSRFEESVTRDSRLLDEDVELNKRINHHDDISNEIKNTQKPSEPVTVDALPDILDTDTLVQLLETQFGKQISEANLAAIRAMIPIPKALAIQAMQLTYERAKNPCAAYYIKALETLLKASKGFKKSNWSGASQPYSTPAAPKQYAPSYDYQAQAKSILGDLWAHEDIDSLWEDEQKNECGFHAALADVKKSGTSSYSEYRASCRNVRIELFKDVG